MIFKRYILAVMFLINFTDFSFSFVPSHLFSLNLQQQQERFSYRQFELGFMSAVADAPIQSTVNFNLSSITKSTFKIKEAKLQDLAPIVSLRVNVFYPEVCIYLSLNKIAKRLPLFITAITCIFHFIYFLQLKTVESFHTRILDKMKQRRNEVKSNRCIINLCLTE
jgi:hypothetical protein